jgi:hypothetical protein
MTVFTRPQIPQWFPAAETFQRVGEQTGLFSLLKKAARLVLVRPGRHCEPRADVKFGEVRDPVDAVDRPGHAALQKSPREARQPSDPAKREHEAVGDGGHE